MVLLAPKITIVFQQTDLWGIPFGFLLRTLFPMQKVQTAYLSLGSNVGHRALHLQRAILRIGARAGTVSALSRVYETPAWGFESDPFLNLCLAVETALPPEELMETLLNIETQLGRVRQGGAGYAARTLDIDLLYYGREVVATERLQVPHPLLQKRKFVLKPLADIAPQFYHPVLNKDTRNLLQECLDESQLEKIPLVLYKTRTELFASANFIAIEGNIGAGKTTLSKMISDDLNAKLVLERFADNPFLPQFYKDPARYAFPLEMSFLADRYQQFTDDTARPDLFKNFMVSDYHIFKSLIFAQVTLGEDEFNLYRKMFNFMYREVTKPGLYVYLNQSMPRLLENIKKRGRDYELDIQANYLEQINNGYMNFIKTQPQQKSLIINVEELDFVASQNDYEYVLQQIEEALLQPVPQN